MQRVEDSGSVASNNMDVPSRWLPALVAGLAYHVAIKKPEVSDRAPMLRELFEEQWSLSADADREKASLYLAPSVNY